MKSGSHITDIKKRNGTLRDNRLPKNLLESPFRIDDRSLWDLLAYISSYLENINYFNTENRINGDWKNLVDKDSLIIMASIINSSTNNIDDLIRTYDRKKVQEDDQLKDDIIDLLLFWWEKIHEWAKILNAANEKNLSEKIKSSLINSITFNRKYIVVLDGKPNLSNLREASKKSDTAGDSLDAILHDFQKAIGHIKETTKIHFEASLLQSDAHLPHNAMYIAFALLYHKLQEKLNGLSQRHLDFYYDKVLQLKMQEGSSTKAIVNLDLQPMVQSTVIPKGTKLSAGKILGSKTEILFETNESLIGYQAELVNIQNLFINSNKYIEVGTNEPIISSITYNQLFRFSKDQMPRSDWHVFGANKKTVQDSKIDAHKSAKVGFIIGSPVLFLSEGKREISIQLNFEERTSRDVFWKLLNEIRCHKNKNLSMHSVISMVFQKGFKISYTNKEGWIPCDDYMIEFDEAANYFTIKFILDISHPSLELSEAIEEQLSWPSIKVELNEYAPVFGYSFFKMVEIETIDIDVAVYGMKNLSLYNNIGKMPAGKPFELFGPQPKKGDYFMLGHSELFKKQINSFELELDWETVPKDFGGFETYYEGYGASFNDGTFKVQFSALSNGYWYPSQSKNWPQSDLFCTTDCLTPEGYESEQIDDSSLLEFENFAELGIPSEYSLQDPLLYDVTTQGGFVRMTFTSPDYGFGLDLYQEEFTAVATFNAKNKKQLPYPNKPFIPKIKGAAVHYKASDQLSFVERIVTSGNSNLHLGDFKHITPYIVEDIIVDQMVKKHTLLPNFEEEGYLILGLMGVTSRTDISIYFNFKRSSTTANIKESSLKWEYFSLPEWREFEPSGIIRDDTEGFLKSGIVQLTMPMVEGASRGIDSSVLWIRASTRGDVENYPKIKGIYLNAVEATCISNDPTIIGQKIAPQSIIKMDGKFPDIKVVHQAAESFHGRIPEIKKHYYTRVSERLRHKGRAVTLWDYERLILENFEDVLIAKCTSFNEDFEPVPGHVKVVVLSRRWSKNDPYYFSKMQLEKMKNFLNKISSSFIDIEVMNPMIEYLLVNCRARFNRVDAGLNYRQKLSDDIAEFLSPISKMDENNGGIGGSIMPSTVVNYVENLPYIQRLEKLNIEHIIIKGMNSFILDVHENEKIINAQTPWSILAPAKEHRVVIDEDVDKLKILADLEVGIGTIGVGMDFIIGNEHDRGDDPVIVDENTP